MDEKNDVKVFAVMESDHQVRTERAMHQEEAVLRWQRYNQVITSNPSTFLSKWPCRRRAILGNA